MNRNFRKIISFISLFVCLLPFYSCKKPSPVEIINPPEIIQPGSRDYIWTSDTTDPMPFNFMNRMWGDADSNIWAVGGAGHQENLIWRYDGNKWSRFPIVPGIDPSCIFGFGKDIWIGSASGEFWHYDGTTFNHEFTYNRPDGRIFPIENIWGDSPYNLYAVGSAFPEDGIKSIAAMMHYDGQKWENVNIPRIEGGFIDIKRGKGSDQNYYIFCLKAWPDEYPDSNSIYSFDGKNIKLLYSGRTNRDGQCNVLLFGDKMYFTIGPKLCVYKNDRFETVLDMTNTDFGGGISGRSEKDFFYTTQSSLSLGHYNGSTFETIVKDYPRLADVILKNSVYFMTTDFSTAKVIFLTGKIKNNAGE